MKYNPIRHEEALKREGLANIHLAQPEETIQGALQILYELQTYTAEIMGMSGASLTPMAGAQGELAGMLMIRAYHRDKKDNRRKVLIPTSAHGTNPATAAMAGFEVVNIRTDGEGNIDLDHFRDELDADVAAAMMTQPNTLGLFDRNVQKVAELLHSKGALLYGDGANMNALMGKAKPGALGFDVEHINTHKAWTTPHGGGGPGAGPISVGEKLLPFLPGPIVKEDSGVYHWFEPDKSIGRLGTGAGNFGVLLRAYQYIRTMGSAGLREVTENAVLNANVLRVLLDDSFYIKYGQNRYFMHEVVVSGIRQKNKGVKTLDLAKRLIDYGFHPPTIYFPHDVEEALMLEPTETEGYEDVAILAIALKAIAQEVEDPANREAIFSSAPHFTPVGRLDEVTAARHPVLRWTLPKENLLLKESEPQTA